MLPRLFRIPSVVGNRGRAIIREGPGPAALRERPLTRKHGEKPRQDRTKPDSASCRCQASPGRGERGRLATDGRVSGSSPSRRIPCPWPRRQRRSSAHPRPRGLGRSSPRTEPTGGKASGLRGPTPRVTHEQPGTRSKELARIRFAEPVCGTGLAGRRVSSAAGCFRFPVQTPRFGPDSAPGGTQNGDSRAVQRRLPV